MTNIVITDRERDGLEDVFSVLDISHDKNSSIFTQLLNKITNFFFN